MKTKILLILALFFLISCSTQNNLIEMTVDGQFCRKGDYVKLINPYDSDYGKIFEVLMNPEDVDGERGWAVIGTDEDFRLVRWGDVIKVDKK